MEQERQGNLWAALGLSLLVAGAAVWAAEVTGIPLFDEGAEAVLVARLALPCDVTIAQFGPGERWMRHHHIYECARAAVTIPAHILTWPLAQ